MLCFCWISLLFLLILIRKPDRKAMQHLQSQLAGHLAWWVCYWLRSVTPTQSLCKQQPLRFCWEVFFGGLSSFPDCILDSKLKVKVAILLLWVFYVIPNLQMRKPDFIPLLKPTKTNVIPPLSLMHVVSKGCSSAFISGFAGELGSAAGWVLAVLSTME